MFYQSSNDYKLICAFKHTFYYFSEHGHIIIFFLHSVQLIVLAIMGEHHNLILVTEWCAKLLTMILENKTWKSSMPCYLVDSVYVNW